MAEKKFPVRGVFINGEWETTESLISVINPANEEPVGSIPRGGAKEINEAVQSARFAFERKSELWSKASGTERAKYLKAIATRVVEKKAQLAELESVDCGKPLDEALWDMDDVAGCFQYYAELAEALDKDQNRNLKLPMDTFTCQIRKEPIGVVGLITPWNYPLLMAAWKVAPALAAGCTIVLKPSELASLTCLELGEIARDVNLPAGVLNIVTGYGHEAGEALTNHKGIDKLAFTGSSFTGKKVMKAAAEGIKPVSLELGGKSALIVFDDVDIEKAVEWAMFGCFWTNGQICSATSRLLLHENIATEFLDKMVEWAKSIKISDPLESGCRLGPIVSKSQYDKVIRFVESAKEEGAKVLCGGERPEHLSKKGFFIEPTIISVPSPDVRVWREEVFGPILSVLTFEKEEEAIRLANDTNYGLAGGVISRDKERCKRVSEALDCGIVWVNCSQPCFCQAPWGGKKSSGFGRELGEWGLDNYLSVKQITSYISDDQWGWYPKPSAKL